MNHWRRRIQTLSGRLLGLTGLGIGLLLGALHPARAEGVFSHPPERFSFLSPDCPGDGPAYLLEAPWLQPLSAPENLFLSPPQQTLEDHRIGRPEQVPLPESRSQIFLPTENSQCQQFVWENEPAWAPFMAPSVLPVHKAAERVPSVTAQNFHHLPSHQGTGHKAAEQTPGFAPAGVSAPIRLGGRILSGEREFSRWSWPTGAYFSGRPDQLQRTIRQAEQHIQRAFELAGRRAYFSARAELITALELLAQGLDQQHQTNRHRQALAQGLTALEEADDFAPGSGPLAAIRDLAVIIASHQTPVLQGTPPDTLTPMEALQRYFTYAQEQLALAAGGEPAGSRALHGLGKLYAAMGEQADLGLKASDSKAMVFYQAALLVDPANYMAANDLGVLLARSGWYEEAMAALTYSLRIQSHPVGWRNLAIVYRQLGQYDLALQAAQRWQMLRQQQQAGLPAHVQTTDVVVHWLPPEQFAAIGQQPPSDRRPPPAVELNPPNSQTTRSSPAAILPPHPKNPFATMDQLRPRREDRPSGSSSPDPAPNQNKPLPFWKTLLAGPLAVFQRAGSDPPAADASSGAAASNSSSWPHPPQRGGQPSAAPSATGMFR